MFKVKNNDEIGRYLSDLIDKKYIKTRRFCKAYIQALGKEVTDEEIQRQEKRILAIRKGKNAIQLEDLPVFTELFDISCEEILSAGDCHSVNENHITNYQLAFSHDERLWKSYISEDGDRFLNPDEYDKTILDYAFELKNYPLLKYLVDNHYIWFVEQNPGERCGMSFYGGTSIKRRPQGNSKTMEAQLTGNDSLRRKMIVLAIENNDMDMLVEFRAREIPLMYNKLQGADLSIYFDEDLIDAASCANENILDYFSETITIKPTHGQAPFQCMYPFFGALIEKMIEHNNPYAETVLKRCIDLNYSRHCLIIASTMENH